jgi:tryptophan synthase beta chain
MKTMDVINNKIHLPAEKIPTHWLNIKPSIGGPEKFPPMYLPNGQLASFEAMCTVFPTECVIHGATMDPLVEIPKEVREGYAINNRPTPIQRAFRLEKYLGLDPDKQRIYFKREDVSPTGSHKANAAIPQAFYAKKQGLEGLTTETGAGQWGSALCFAGALYGLKIKVFQVRISYQQKPGRLVLMKAYGGEVIPSPSPLTNSGKAIYDKDPNHPGSLGIAISEAVEASMASRSIRYTLGSVVDFVLLYQTVIGQEAKIQMEMVKDYPDVIIGSIGGGSNFAGLALPFMKDKLEGKKPDLDFIGVEPAACPSMTRGKYVFDYGDAAKMAPIVKMYTLGHQFVPPPVHAGGLRYHGSAPILGVLKEMGMMRNDEVHQLEAIKSGMLFCNLEGLLPAPETCHAIAQAIREAKKAKENNQKKTILFNYSGHGFFDIQAYKLLEEGKLEDYELPQKQIEESIASIQLPPLQKP